MVEIKEDSVAVIIIVEGDSLGAEAVETEEIVRDRNKVTLQI